MMKQRTNPIFDMKILFIASRKYDYLQDAIFSGLVKQLGWKNVHTFSFYRNFFLPVKKYPRNIGYSNQALLSKKLFFNKISQYDVIILAACKPDAFKDYLSVLPHISIHTKTVFIDGGDASLIGGDLSRLGQSNLWNRANQRPFDYVFKREYLKNEDYPENVFPCPFAFNYNVIKDIRKSAFIYDVTFWAVESHPVRTKALNLLSDKFDCQANGTTSNQSFYKYKRKGNRYLEELQKAKITLNFRGSGWDTLRYWEVPALGRFMVSQEPAIVIPNNYEHEKHVVYIHDDLSNLIEVCEYYLKNEVKREEIAKRAEIHTKEFHTDIARANYMMKIIVN